MSAATVEAAAEGPFSQRTLFWGIFASLLAAAGFFLAVLLHFSIAMSRLSEQTSRLAQRLAMLEERTAAGGPQPAPPPELTPDDV